MDPESEREWLDTDTWVATIRDPANKASEGKRTIKAGKDAHAGYEVAPLPDGRWAVKVNCGYDCGDSHSVGIPWRVQETREACLAFFLEQARFHFGMQVFSSSSAQKKAQKRMLQLLKEGLVFVEPPAVPREKKEPGEDPVAKHRKAVKDKMKQDLPLFADLIEHDE